MKKIFSIALCFLILTASVCMNTSYAAEYKSVGGRFGDLDNQYGITASDARKCLRFASKVEEIPNVNCFFKADINADGLVTASDARAILLDAAGIEPLHARVNLTDGIGSAISIGSFISNNGTAYMWNYSVTDEKGVRITSEVFTAEDDSDNFIVGGPIYTIFIIELIESGSYTITFTLSDEHWNKENPTIIDELSVTVCG